MNVMLVERINNLGFLTGELLLKVENIDPEWSETLYTVYIPDE